MTPETNTTFRLILLDTNIPLDNKGEECMKRLITLIVVAVSLTLFAGCSMVVDPNLQPQSRSQQTSPQQIEPAAGQWQTWVLTSLDEVRPTPPPDQAATMAEITELKTLASQRDDSAEAQIAYWDAGSPSYRWIEIALNQFKSKPMPPVRVARGLSLMNVAIYDAMVAAWDAKYTYNRPRPSLVDPSLATSVTIPSNSPAYPSEHAVAAGAAAAILSYLYPDDAQTFNAKAEEAAHSRVLAGVQYQSDVEAGLELGRQVALQVIERAKVDRSDAVWDGVMPSEPGHWTGENPIEPLGGTWQPWVLASGDELRPPPPPAYDSAEKLAELQEVQTFTRTWQTDQKALYNQTFEGIFSGWYDIGSLRIFEHHLDKNPPQAARIYAAMSIAHYDAQIACLDAKYAYWAPRPFQLDPELVTLFPTPNHPSYPAAHGCASGAITAVLEHFFPSEAEAIQARADEAAMSRLWAGIHFRSDIETGLALGRSVAQRVIERTEAMVQPE
jgi:membrane-associated phospholipid phosphatase